MNTPPINTDDIIDSRDVIERIKELESSIEIDTEDGADSVEVEELATLKALAEEGESSSDWPHGEILIRDSHFQDYAREYGEDCCEIPTHEHWPLYCIDWEQTARELQQDYVRIEFDGIDYWRIKA